MTEARRDTVVAVFLLLVCGTFFAASFDIRETSYASLGSEVWPRAILAVLFVFSLVLLAQSLKRRDHGARLGGGGIKGWLSAYRNALACYLLFGLYLLTLPYLGMLIGGGLFVFATLTAIGRRDLRSLGLHAAIAAGTIGFMWSVFTYGLNVMLPAGELFYGW